MKKLLNIYSQIKRTILTYGGSDRRVKYLRKQGVRIGQNCIIHTLSFSTEMYLVEIGNDVGISSGTQFITHDGSIKCFRDELEGIIFGKIIIGNNVMIGVNCIILCNTTIGNNCIVGAGSVLRGHFPDNSVIIGNPAKVMYKMNIQKMLFSNSPGLVKINEQTTDEEAQILIKKHFGII